MLDVLVEALMDALFGTSEEEKARRKRQQGTPAQPSGRRPDGGGESGGLTVRELMRRMHEAAREGGPDAPVLVPGYDTPPPDIAPPTPQKQVRPAVRPQPRKSGYQSLAPQMEEVLLEKPAPTPGQEIAARLRGNPQAARDAFIYAEIFGRPLSER